MDFEWHLITVVNRSGFYFGSSNRLGSAKQERIFETTQTEDVISFNAAIGACEKASQWREALHLFFQAAWWQPSTAIIGYSDMVVLERINYIVILFILLVGVAWIEMV